MDLRGFIQFLDQVETLKSVTRHSWTSSGRQESVPEHSWRMAVMAMALGEEFPSTDIKKVLEIIIVHDFGEAYDGDIPAFLENKNKYFNEEKNIQRLTKSLPKQIQRRFINLWKEYNEGITEEAKLAKALDKLEVLIQHNEADISTWIETEYTFNLDYGKKYTSYNKLIREIREIVDERTREKISEA